MQIKDVNKNRRSTLLLAATCIVLQVAFAPFITLGNGRANLALVYAGVVALSTGGRSAVVSGFLAGLFFDLVTTGPIGLMSMLLTVFAYVLGLEERNRFSDGLVSSLSSFGVGSLSVLLAYHLTMLLLGDTESFIDLLVLRTLPTFAMTFVVFLPFAHRQVRMGGKGHGLSSGSKSSSLRGSSHYDVRNL